ncbi:hypothetical protein [Helicobacter sp. MIT 01-3238]|uniref:hypothetical protein n=1 Tax=Helicobacter sp. MIT 01-3238 TaxID=398627 RepID=UPI000E1E6AE3|nr:hypothetical protein [Helicobacter sp. MIT 01-3238]RDU53993.1 hypothetical protein CQA40_04080 [Helicobacter sp. MIT 01-3238]
MFLTRDTLFMNHCIDLAWLAQTLTLPNPPVGALLLDKDYEIISSAIHLKAGKAHAEVLTLLSGYEAMSGEKSGLDKSSEPSKIHEFLCKNHKGLFRDKILLITLEPCNHYGKTPPCAKLLCELKPAKVIIAFKDKWGESSNGAQRLQSAGVKVEFLQDFQSAYLQNYSKDSDLQGGDLQNSHKNQNPDIQKQQNLAQNPSKNTYNLLPKSTNEKILDLLYPFLCLKESGRFNLFKLAMRANGDYKSGSISGIASRTFTHNQRCIAQTIIISGNTALNDTPRLDTRYADSFYAQESSPKSLSQSSLDDFGLDFDSTNATQQNPLANLAQNLTRNLTQSPAQKYQNLAQNLPNIEIFTRDKETLITKAKQDSKLANLLSQKRVSIKTLIDTLSLDSGFTIIEGGFPLLEALIDKVDMVLLHISPSLLSATLEKKGQISEQKNRCGDKKADEQNRLEQILRHFRILHTTILDDELEYTKNIAQNDSNNELFVQDFALDSQKHDTKNTKTLKIDSKPCTQNFQQKSTQATQTTQKSQAKSQDLLVWLKPIKPS